MFFIFSVGGVWIIEITIQDPFANIVSHNYLFYIVHVY